MNLTDEEKLANIEENEMVALYNKELEEVEFYIRRDSSDGPSTSITLIWEDMSALQHTVMFNDRRTYHVIFDLNTDKFTLYKLLNQRYLKYVLFDHRLEIISSGYAENSIRDTVKELYFSNQYIS